MRSVRKLFLEFVTRGVRQHYLRLNCCINVQINLHSYYYNIFMKHCYTIQQNYILCIRGKNGAECKLIKTTTKIHLFDLFVCLIYLTNDPRIFRNKKQVI